MKIIISETAEKQFLVILNYIEETFGKVKRKEFHKYFKDYVNELKKHPNLGKIYRDNIRQLIVKKSLVFYKIEDEKILILFVYDSRMNIKDF